MRANKVALFKGVLIFSDDIQNPSYDGGDSLLTPSPCPNSCTVSPLKDGGILSAPRPPYQLLSAQPLISWYMPSLTSQVCLQPFPEAFCHHHLSRKTFLYDVLPSGCWNKAFCLHV